MKNKYITGVFLPLLAAFIWGVAFTSQSICADYMPAFYLNGIRSLIAATVLFVVSVHIKKKRIIGKAKMIIAAGFTSGLALFMAVNLQQMGIERGTDSGKAGFITAMYAVIVPIYQFLHHKKVGTKIWLAILIAFTGLYLLCITDGFTVQGSDIYVFGSALAFAAQIIFQNYFTKRVEPIVISCGQFLVTGVLSMLCGDIFNSGATVDIMGCLPHLLYMAIFSSCIAYTLQTIALKEGNPTVVSLILCLESVFALLAGAVVLNEHFTIREYVGCGLMLIGVALSQIPDSFFHRKQKS